MVATDGSINGGNGAIIQSNHIVRVVGAIIQSNRWPISGGNYACYGGNGANSIGANSGYDSVGAIIHNKLWPISGGN